MQQSKFSARKRIKSFACAFDGLKVLIKEEHNFRIHLVAAVCAVILGVALSLSLWEWVAIAFAIGFVFVVEAVNSTVERICDFVSPQKHDKIKNIKDISAAAVLIAAFMALAVGLIVFIPKLLLIFI